MPAYAMFEVALRPDASDEALATYAEYRTKVPAMIEAAGGRYLARAWSGEALEGAAPRDRFHLLEFPDADTARQFWASPEYLAVKHLRGDAADVRAILISG
ncbi:MAG: hypothetical protein RL238_3517 [Actinomycetota bacterium]|jgi:uncharacterized protein (DUF1330 family)